MTTESLTGFHHGNCLGSIMNGSEMIPLSGYLVPPSTILPGNSSTTSPTLILPGNPSGSSLDSVAEFKHGTGLAIEWSADEQHILEDGLEKYKEEPNFMKYVKIAAILPDKAVRDVALRCWWMQRKRKRPEELNAGKKVNNRKDKQVRSSLQVNMPTTLPLNMAAFPFMMHHLDQIERMPSEGISGTILHLLKQNAQVFSEIKSNLSSYKLQDNVDLFCYAINNITTILKDMRAMPGLMSQMSPLPVSVDEDLVNSILPDAIQVSYCEFWGIRIR
ncbi:ZZ-type zinc finger-containing protein 3, putative isoform 4 [Hibiscus syriacus]|uniref:ZZ-type zinc finger-containing protein 3, putative isoform 4 n=1 Tax=Hibiscus syriacus TaxID=106335 RepID=A0A6A2Z5T8_HIBSY|nr:ZZ-type zinc finger-containing protein 3, putative isoform 4 [Hibiscus syriacus]